MVKYHGEYLKETKNEKEKLITTWNIGSQIPGIQ